VPTDWGPLVVPKGFSIQRYFGVGQDVGAERIGAALSEFIKPVTPDGRMAFRIGVNGELMYQELNAKGRPAAPAHTLDPKAVAPMVQTQRDRITESFKLDHGEGVTVDKGGIKLTFNGDNTANVDNGWMRRLRQDLVNHEGVRDTVYKDSEGNDIIGVGFLVKHSKTDMRPQSIKVGPDGKVTPAQIQETLMRETDRAAQTATRIMGGTGMRSEAAFKLYSSLAYQSGNGFTKLKAYEPLMRAIVSKDANAAQEALKASPAYRLAHPERQQYYLTNLIAAMKG
jgi:GH24 family phage-related lysozyme (muramidase)